MSDKQNNAPVFSVDPQQIKDAENRLKELPKYRAGLEAAKNMGIDTTDFIDKLDWAESVTRSFLKFAKPESKQEGK